MPLARAPMLFVTVAQEKRDFKIFVILITAWVGVRIPHGPPKRTQLRYFVAKWHSCDSLFSVQFTAQLIAYRLPEFFALLHTCHILRGCINITVVAFFGGCVLIAEVPKNQRMAILSAFPIPKTRRRLLTTTKRVCVIWKTISGSTNCFYFFCADKFKIALDLTNLRS